MFKYIWRLREMKNFMDLSAILKEARIKQTQIWNEGRPQKEKSNES